MVVSLVLPFDEILEVLLHGVVGIDFFSLDGPMIQNFVDDGASVFGSGCPVIWRCIVI